MSKFSKNEKGFSAVEVVLVLVIVILIVIVGLLAYNNNHKPTVVATSNTAKTTKTTAQKSPSKASTPNPYAGWSQYCSTYERACFKYPATWSFQDQCNPSSNCPGINNVTVTSQDGSVLDFASEISGRGGMCPPKPSFIYTKVEAEPHVQGLYLVEGTRSDISGTVIGLEDKENGQTPTVGDSGKCYTYLQFAAHNTANAEVNFSGTMNNSQDLSTAEQILSSYYYQ